MKTLQGDEELDEQIAVRQHARQPAIQVELVELSYKRPEGARRRTAFRLAAAALGRGVVRRRLTIVAALVQKDPKAYEQVDRVEHGLDVEEPIDGIDASEVTEDRHVEYVRKNRGERNERHHKCPPRVGCHFERMMHSDPLSVSDMNIF